jgi:predicted SnoaL-like aldol condensation-catalyzing enzyme
MKKSVKKAAKKTVTKKKALKKAPSALKETAVSFLKLVVSGKIREAFDRYTSSEFRHHNPYSRGDRESLILAMEENESKFPNKIFEIKRVMADGELVSVHSYLSFQSEALKLATVHTFRFKKTKIVEFWDVAGQIPADSPNENGMF